MTVYKPAKSPYFHYDFVLKGRRFYGSTGCATKRDAKAYEARERQKVLLPTRERPPITVDEACGLYSERAEQQSSWPTTRYMLKALMIGLGANKLLSEITQRDFGGYFAGRRHGRSNATVNREIDNASAVWHVAQDARFDVGEMPDWGKLKLKVPAVVRPELTLEQEPKLFAEIRTDVVDCCDFALKSGWRRAEVVGLRWSDCDLVRGYAVTRIKGGDVIQRPLTPTLIAIIANQPKVGPFVFTYVCKANRGRRRKGERYPISITVLREAFNDARQAAGLEGLRFHDLRHTRGTRIVRQTGSLAAAKRALEHKSIKTTLRYAHVLDDDVRRALDASESRTIPEQATDDRKKA